MVSLLYFKPCTWYKVKKKLCEKGGIQNYLWDDLFVGWTCGMLISFDVCCGTDLWDCTMLKGNRF